MVVKKNFDAGRTEGGNVLSIDFVFGVELIDNGDYFDPGNYGTLVLKPGNLDIVNNQVWLRQFCINVKEAEFYVESPTCDYLEGFFNKLTSSCVGNSTLCCGKSLPYTSNEFMMCAADLEGNKDYKIYQLLFTKNSMKTLAIKVISFFFNKKGRLIYLKIIHYIIQKSAQNGVSLVFQFCFA